MEVIIDRFEGNYAVVELDLGVFVNLPKELVPKAREGDVVEIKIVKGTTKQRKKRVNKLMNKLFVD